MWKSLRRRILGRDLDPGRVERVFREYDQGRGYGPYHESCRRALARPLPDRDRPFAVSEEGFERVPVMDAEHAAGLLARVRESAEAVTFRNNEGIVRELRLHGDPPLEEELLAASLPPELDERVLAFFGSEYLVHWYVVTETRPGRSRNSFLWHCDRGPSAHLKLLVYLNGTGEHGGNTEFVDLRTTERLGRAGYVFGKVADRQADLSGLARRVGASFEPRRLDVPPGQGILFQPARVLHRGILPRRRARLLLAICLLPSPVPWREAWRRRGVTRLHADEKWHEDARELLGALAPA